MSCNALSTASTTVGPNGNIAAAGAGGSLLLSAAEYTLVKAAFASFFNDDDAITGNAVDGKEKDGASGNGVDDRLVPLTELLYRFNAVAHPRVKEGSLAPTAAKDTLQRQFGRCAREHDGNVTFSEFLAYHDKLVDEALEERGVSDVDAFIATTIRELWRLGSDLLLPTGLRPCFPITAPPSGLYASQLMTLVWTEPDPNARGKFIIKGIKEVVRPIFKRCDVPEEVRGFFAYPEELAGMQVRYVDPQISIQRWIDFVWSYAEGKYCGVPGIISARVDLDTVAPVLRQFIVEHNHATKVLSSIFVPTTVVSNPMYKRSSDAYGYAVTEECKKLHAWKVRSLQGKQYGLQYQGLQGNFFSKQTGPTICNTATGINL